MKRFRILRQYRVDYDRGNYRDDQVIRTILVYADDEEAESIRKMKSAESQLRLSEARRNMKASLENQLKDAEERIKLVQEMTEEQARILGLNLFACNMKASTIRSQLNEVGMDKEGDMYWIYDDLEDAIDAFNFIVDHEGRIHALRPEDELVSDPCAPRILL